MKKSHSVRRSIEKNTFICAWEGHQPIIIARLIMVLVFESRLPRFDTDSKTVCLSLTAQPSKFCLEMVQRRHLQLDRCPPVLFKITTYHPKFFQRLTGQRCAFSDSFLVDPLNLNPSSFNVAHPLLIVRWCGIEVVCLCVQGRMKWDREVWISSPKCFIVLQAHEISKRHRSKLQKLRHKVRQRAVFEESGVGRLLDKNFVHQTKHGAMYP